MVTKSNGAEDNKIARLSLSPSSAADLLDAILAETSGRKEGDLKLLRACRSFAEASRQLQALRTQSGPLSDEDLRLDFEKMLGRKLKQTIRLIADVSATTLKGHRARAAVALVLDQGAMLEQARGGHLFGRVLLALLVDLITTAHAPHLQARSRTRQPKPR